MAVFWDCFKLTRGVWGTCRNQCDLSESLIFVKLIFKNETESPIKTPSGTAGDSMPDREAEMPSSTSDFFLLSQLIVLPKLNDLFLELREMQYRERDRQSSRQTREVDRGNSGRREGDACVFLFHNGHRK